MDIFEIPPIIVALFCLLTTIVLATHDNDSMVSLRIFSLSTGAQFIIYMIFSFTNLPLELKQFIARSNVILTCITLSTILLYARKGKK